MDISYDYDVQDVLINSGKTRPEPEPNWRSLYEAERQVRLGLQELLDIAEINLSRKTIELYNKENRINKYKETLRRNSLELGD